MSVVNPVFRVNSVSFQNKLTMEDDELAQIRANRMAEMQAQRVSSQGI